MRSMSAFLGLGQQVLAEKREGRRVALEAQAAAEHDPLACRVGVKAGEYAGQRGLLQTWAGTDGKVAVLMMDGHVVRVEASQVEKLADAAPRGYEALDAEHQQVARDHGFQAAVRTPASDEESKAVVHAFIRSADNGKRVLGEQMLLNRKALLEAQVKDVSFAHLAVYAAADVRELGVNQNELTVAGKTVFFSYDQPVGGVTAGKTFITDATLSPTGARHLKAWLAGRKAAVTAQANLNTLAAALMAEAKKPIVAAETGAQQHNRRQDAIMDKAKELEKGRLAKGEKPNPNLTDPAKEPAAQTVKANGAIADFKVEDIGLEHPQNFAGRGTSPENRWDAVFTGVGNSYNEAFNDALELAAASGYDTEGMGPGETDPRADEDMVGEDSELLYHVALYVNGERRLDASRRILVAKPATPAKTREMVDRILQERKAAKGGEAAPAAAPDKLTPPSGLADMAAPKYPGVQKSEFRKQKTGEEAWKLRRQGKVEETRGNNPLLVQEDKPGEVDETKLGKLVDAPEELKALVASSVERQANLASIEALLAETATKVKESEGYDDEKKAKNSDDEKIVERLKAIAAEAVKMDDAILVLKRGGLKPSYEFTPAQLEKMKRVTALQDKLSKKLADLTAEYTADAEKSGRVKFTEPAPTPTLFTDPAKRKGEGGKGLPGADTLKKAGVKSALTAGLLDELKKAASGLFDMVKELFADENDLAADLAEAAAEPEAKSSSAESKSEPRAESKSAESKSEPKKKAESKSEPAAASSSSKSGGKD